MSTSKIIKELCSFKGMNKSRTNNYHAMSNCMCERFIRTLLDMLYSLQSTQKVNWKAYVNPLVYAYNCTGQGSTGYTPYLLMFVRPVDITLMVRKNEEPNKLVCS